MRVVIATYRKLIKEFLVRVVRVHIGMRIVRSVGGDYALRKNVIIAQCCYTYIWIRSIRRTLSHAHEFSTCYISYDRIHQLYKNKLCKVVLTEY